MDLNKPLSEEEFKQMLSLLKRHAESSMDQWEAWKLDSKKGLLYIDLKLSNIKNDSSYTDLNKLFK